MARFLLIDTAVKYCMASAQAIHAARDHERAKLLKVSEILSRCRPENAFRPVLQQEVDLICGRLVRLRGLEAPDPVGSNGHGHGLDGDPQERGYMDRDGAAVRLDDLRERSVAFYTDLAASVREQDLAELFRTAAVEDSIPPGGVLHRERRP